MRYEFRVRGRLAGDWSDWFDGLSVKPLPDGVTVIVGEIRDQPELLAILTRLLDLNVEVIAARQTPDGP